MTDRKQEPVAWEQLHEHMAGPFYKSPRPWVGLTDEEVDALQDFAYADDVEFIRHIEAKIKEKNT